MEIEDPFDARQRLERQEIVWAEAIQEREGSCPIPGVLPVKVGEKYVDGGG
jgi:hypothetical protein